MIFPFSTFAFSEVPLNPCIEFSSTVSVYEISSVFSSLLTKNKFKFSVNFWVSVVVNSFKPLPFS